MPVSTAVRRRPGMRHPRPGGGAAENGERIVHLAALALALVLFALLPLDGEAQQPGKVWRIGVLMPGSPTPGSPQATQVDDLRAGLRKLGYVASYVSSGGGQCDFNGHVVSAH